MGDERTWTIRVCEATGERVVYKEEFGEWLHHGRPSICNHPKRSVKVVEASPVPSAPGGPSEEAVAIAQGVVDAFRDVQDELGDDFVVTLSQEQAAFIGRAMGVYVRTPAGMPSGYTERIDPDTGLQSLHAPPGRIIDAKTHPHLFAGYPTDEAVAAALGEYERGPHGKCAPGDEARNVAQQMLKAAYAIDGLPFAVGDEGASTVIPGAAGGLGGPDGA